MSYIALALVGIVIMLVLLFLGMHIGFAMMLVGFFGYWTATGNFNATLGILRQVPATTASNYSLCVIPLFILMGNLAFAGGLSDGLSTPETNGSAVCRAAWAAPQLPPVPDLAPYAARLQPRRQPWASWRCQK